MVLQYAMRTLAEHPVDLVFFYVPQLVQTLREDVYGYIAQFILHTSLVSQLFCHQIIWNMEANKYKDDLAEVEDPLKPTLDAMIQRIVGQLTGEAQAYYEREFAFFKKVTGISGSLRPYVKCSKPEKKAKIDEEMAKIAVEEGVYLPSNPDGAVVDIDRTSGRPLQSAAKTPFMATFKVRRAVAERTNPDDPPHVDVWQSAIFKVGDDCRQDMLALQVIAQFKNIFMAIGLDVYLDPYRVTATAPGCGVIDVVPNATSRDEMGRAKINDLSDFYKNRYGDEHSVAFQQARLNFIQSMAAYSVVCHILQIRDRTTATSCSTAKDTSCTSTLASCSTSDPAACASNHTRSNCPTKWSTSWADTNRPASPCSSSSSSRPTSPAALLPTKSSPPVA